MIITKASSANARVDKGLIRTLLLATAAAGAFVGQSPAHAQAVTPGPDSATPESQAANSAGAEGGEIIVTAQKRAESAQNVPIAMQVFSGQALAKRSILTIDQIGTSVSNTQVFESKGASQPNWTIRGVALFDYNINNNPSTAVYVDDVYQPSLVMGAAGIFDLKRVEVLKGPQSGLYGRNALGGAVQIISNVPNDGDHDGYVSANYGSWNRYRIEGGQTVSLGGGAAVRLAAFHDGSFGGGWQTSLADNSKWGKPDRTAVRAVFHADPGNGLDVQLKLQYMRDKSQTPLASANGAYDLSSSSLDGGLAFCPAVLAGRLDNGACGTLSQVIDPGALSPGGQSNNGRTVTSQPIDRLDNEEWGGTLRVSYDFGPAKLTSITSFDHFDFGFTYDYDASELNLGGWTEAARLESIGQEFRLESDSSKRFRWIAGLQYSHVDISDRKLFDWSDNAYVQAGFSFIPLLPQDAFLDVSYRQTTEYLGLYGQFDYDLTPRLTLTGSLRYSDEKTNYRDGQDGFATIGFPLLQNLSSTYRLGDHLTGKATLTWKPSAGKLLYATVSRGYKSGGVFGGFPQTPEDVTPYKEEIIWAYEGGFKSSWFDRKLQVNGAVFYYDHKNIQAFTTLPSTLTPGQFVFRLANVGNGYHLGAELDATLRPVRGLSLGGSVGYLKAKVNKSDVLFFTFDQQAIPWTGLPIDYAPTWSATANASYEFALTGDLDASIDADYSYRSALVRPVTPVDQALRGIAGYGIANGQVSITSHSLGASLGLWVKNLFNKAYVIDKNGDGLGSYYQIYGEPRSFGVTLSKRW